MKISKIALVVNDSDAQDHVEGRNAFRIAHRRVTIRKMNKFIKRA